jgi:ubiquitin carboxyl-terminal hydrolase 14
MSTSPEARFISSVKSLFEGMRTANMAIPPLALLGNLRLLAPQFAEQDAGGGFSQQGETSTRLALMIDADEAWTQIIAAFRGGLPGDGSRGSFVDDYMSIELRHT